MYGSRYPRRESRDVPFSISEAREAHRVRVSGATPSQVKVPAMPQTTRRTTSHRKQPHPIWRFGGAMVMGVEISPPASGSEPKGLLPDTLCSVF